jgi:hypothetical protein
VADIVVDGGKARLAELSLHDGHRRARGAALGVDALLDTEPGGGGASAR